MNIDHSIDIAGHHVLVFHEYEAALRQTENPPVIIKRHESLRGRILLTLVLC